MRPLLFVLALIALLCAAPTAEARRGSCANGQCGVSSKASFTTANLTPAKWDASKHPRDPVTGRFIPAPKAAAVESDDHRDYGRPVRKAGRAVGAAARWLNDHRPRLFRGCRRGC